MFFSFFLTDKINLCSKGQIRDIVVEARSTTKPLNKFINLGEGVRLANEQIGLVTQFRFPEVNVGDTVPDVLARRCLLLVGQLILLLDHAIRVSAEPLRC